MESGPRTLGTERNRAEPRETSSVHFQYNVKKGSAHEELLLMHWPAAHDNHMPGPWPGPTLAEN